MSASDPAFADLPTAARIGATLRSWRSLGDHLLDLTEAEVAQALRVEEANRRRAGVLRRLRQRLGRIRAKALAERAL